MSRNLRKPYFKQITITASPVAIEADETPATFWLQAAFGNTGAVTLTDPDDGTFTLSQGEFTPTFEGVDLNSLRVSGTAGDVLQLVGFLPWS